jgi:chaperonin GroES
LYKKVNQRLLILQVTQETLRNIRFKEVYCMKIKPLGDRVVIQASESKEQSRGGIVLPDTAKEKPQEGKVVAAGVGKKTDDGKIVPLSVKVGDIVLYGKYSGTEITVDGEEYLIVREEDILAIVA